MRPLKLAILGATGVVGRAALEVLEERDVPIAALRLFASGRSDGSELEFRGEEVVVEAPEPHAFRGSELAIFAAPPAVSREWAPRARADGCAVVDASPAFRLDPEVPLVVPEVNVAGVAGFRARGVVSSPGGVATPLALVLKPLADAAGLARVVVSTYESVSGAGRRAVEQLEREAQALMNGVEPEEPDAIPHRIAFNLVPQIGAVGPDGYAEEEAQLLGEIRKLLGTPDLRLTATAVRVPVFYGHSLSVNVATRRPLAASEARELLRRSPGLKVVDDAALGVYPMPMLAVNDDAVLVGRIRDDLSQPGGIELFVAADNLRKGAATNAVQIAIALAERHL